MQKMMGLMRKCIDDYHMISPGDKIAVGVSGGKDSLTLLTVLAALRSYYPAPFELAAITIDMGLDGMDFSPVEQYCKELNVGYFCKKTEIGPIIFDYRKEKNPCSMCAKMRRGALNDTIRELGFGKIALGHHFDDAVETFLMSLLYEGRIGCFEPVTYLSRSGVTQIRPMLYVGEKAISHFAEAYDLPVVHNVCPADKHTKRQEVKDLISSLTGAVSRPQDENLRRDAALSAFPVGASKNKRKKSKVGIASRARYGILWEIAAGEAGGRKRRRKRHMKKGWIIALCVLLVLGAGAGFAYYRLYSTAQDAEQMQRTIFEQYEAMLQNAEQTTLTVTENGETVGVYTLDALGLLDATKQTIAAGFTADERMNPDIFDQKGVTEKLEWRAPDAHAAGHGSRRSRAVHRRAGRG